MTTIRRRAALGAAVLFAAAMGSASAVYADDGITQDEIVIGTFGPMTGPVYMYGQLAMNGLDVVFENINKEGGIHGRKLRLVREDDRCSSEGAITAVRRLIYSHKVFAIVGGGCLSAAIAAKPEIVKARIPWIINVSVADELSAPPEPNIYSAMVTARAEARGQVKFAIDNGATKFAIVAQRDAWGRARYLPILEDLKQRNIAPATDEEITEEINDATPQALRLRASGADAVLLLGRPKAAAVVVRDSIKVGFKPKWWIAQTAVQDLDGFEKQVGIPGAIDNVVTISSTLGQPGDEKMKEWSARLKGLFPYDNLSSFNLNGIGSGLLTADVLKRAGPNVTRESFLAELGKTRGFDTGGIYAGPLNCDAGKDHQCNKAMAWIQKKQGKVEIISVITVD
jgi:branched-chain amino acid transport system substrate-binding protein